MARLITSGAELNSTTNGIEFDASTAAGGLSNDTGTVRSGTYSFKVTSSANQPVFRYQLYTANSTTRVLFGRAYFNFTSFPATTQAIIACTALANTVRSTINITSTGTLVLFDSAGTTVGSPSVALTAGHWYRVELKNDTTATKALEARFLDCGTSGVDPGGAGTTIASGTNTTVSAGRFAFGLFNGSANTATVYIDDIAVNDDDSTGGGPTTYVGSSKIIPLRPDSAGDSNGFLVNVGGTAGAANNFTRVNEVTPDGATTYNASAVLNAEDLFNCGASGIGANDTVNVVSVGGQFADLLGADATAGFKFEVEKTASGTKAQSTQINPNNTSFVVNSAATTSASLYPITLYKDPDANAWTKTTLDTMQIGYIITATNVDSMAISNVLALVDYTPTIASSKGSTLMTMGVG